LGESGVQEYLATFECPRNLDVQEFLRRRAIPHEKALKSRTYLVTEAGSIPEQPTILAYFSLAIHLMEVQGSVSKTLQKRLHGLYFPNNTRPRPLPCFIIGQIGKDARHSDRTTGSELLDMARRALLMANDIVGGRFIKIDCEDIPALVDLYQRNGFRAVQNDVSTGLLEMVLFF